MSRPSDAFTDFWPPEQDPSRRDGELRGPSGPAPTPAMRRAEETTRIAREATDAAADKRATAVARLKAARLEKEASDAVEAAVVADAPKPKRVRKAK